MKVTGPNWPSTRSLKDALADVASQKVLNWGAAPMNKLDAMNTLRAKGVQSPEVTRDLATARRWVALGHTVWGRRLMHKEGTDIVRDLDAPAWAKRDFWVHFVPSSFDFRVHVWDGVAFRLGVKQHAEPQLASPVRSDRNGWLLSYNPDTYALAGTKAQRNAIREAAIAACAALGVLGGAVDVLLGVDGTPYVLEVNTAPALGEFTLAAYVEVITRWATAEAVKPLAPPVAPKLPNPPAPEPPVIRQVVAQREILRDGLGPWVPYQAAGEAMDNQPVIIVFQGVAKTVVPGDPMYRVLRAAAGV